MKSIYKPSLQIANPAWSPDGKSIAFIEGLMSDEPAVGGDVYLVPATGGKAANLTPERKSSASWLTWTTDGKILFAEYVEADSAVSLLDPATPRSQLSGAAAKASPPDRGIRIFPSRQTARLPP